jgi:hypothetical protein
MLNVYVKIIKKIQILLTTTHAIDISPPINVGLICSGDVDFLK